MTSRSCLRCDWLGDIEERRCPNCGEQPLYVVEDTSPTRAAPPLSSPLVEPTGSGANLDEGARPPPLHPNPSSPLPDAAAPSSPPARSAGTLVLAGLVVIVVLGTWLKSHETPAGDGSLAAPASPSATPRPDPSPTPAGAGVVGGPLEIGRHSLPADGIPFSIRVPTVGWENHGNIYISKSAVGPQGAEAIIYWTTLAEGPHRPCGQWWGSPVGSIADFAANASGVRGTELVSGPSHVTVGRRAAQHVVFTVRKDVGCNPGFFYRWNEARPGGAFWTNTDVGDTIRVWLVNPGRDVLYIEGGTHANARPELKREIQQIVRSIRFG